MNQAVSRLGRHNSYELMRDIRARAGEPFNKSCVFSKMPHEEQYCLCGLIRERWNTFCANRCNYLKSNCYELVHNKEAKKPT